MTLRPPAREDVPRIAELLNRVADADGAGHVDAAEIEEWFNSSDHDVPGNFRVAELDGELVGYIDLVAEQNETLVWIDMRVPPERWGSGVEDELLDWALLRGRDVATPDGVIRQYVAAGGPGHAAAERHGYRQVRHSFEMEITLAAPPPPTAAPEGIVLRDYRPGEEPALFDAHVDAFQDGWVPWVQTYASWFEERIEAPSFKPELWVVAEADGQIAGFAFNRLRSDRGWVGVLGVRRPWRKRGLGLALLLESFRRFYEHGERRVGLGVDGENPTNAVALYLRAGMHQMHRWDAYERTLA